MMTKLLSLLGKRTRTEDPKAGLPVCRGRRANGSLLVDCRGCPHGQSLTDHHCLKGVLRSLASDTKVREVVLARDWEIVYDQHCVGVLADLGEVIRFCNGLGPSLPFEDCSACPSNPRAIIGRVAEAVPSASPELETRLAHPSGGHGRACEQCVQTLTSNLDHIRMLLGRSNEAANRMAYRVVAGDER